MSCDSRGHRYRVRVEDQQLSSNTRFHHRHLVGVPHLDPTLDYLQRSVIHISHPNTAANGRAPVATSRIITYLCTLHHHRLPDHLPCTAVHPARGSRITSMHFVSALSDRGPPSRVCASQISAGTSFEGVIRGRKSEWDRRSDVRWFCYGTLCGIIVTAENNQTCCRRTISTGTLGRVQ